MKLFVRISSAAALLLLSALVSFADSRSAIGDIVKAQIVINKVLEVVNKFKELERQSIVLEAPAPITANTGRYLLPYKANGETTEWADKALNAQIGKAVGEKAGDAAANAVASKIPFGGIAGGLLKKKTKEVAAVAALGGTDYLKKTSELSFDNLNDYAVYLHVRHSADSNYKEVLATAIALYPELEGRFDGAVRDAYQQQAAKAKKAA